MGTINVDLILRKDFSAGLKTFSVYGRENSSPSSPSSLFGVQVVEIIQSAVMADRKVILPEMMIMLPMLPQLKVAQAINGGWMGENHNIW